MKSSISRPVFQSSWRLCLAITAWCCTSGYLCAEEAAIPIRSIQDLQQIGNTPAFPLSGSYVLESPLDASDTDGWHQGAGFLPIGSADAPFTGVFDGRGHEILHLHCVRPKELHVGLFACLGANAYIKNLHLKQCRIEGRKYVGALVGENLGRVNDCSADGVVHGYSHVGGLLGANRSHVSACRAVGKVAGREYVGGLCGMNDEQGRLENGAAEASVVGEEAAGGLVGANLHGSILRGESRGEVNALRYVGGLAGTNFGTVAESRAATHVRATAFAGGLIGVSFGIIDRCCARGNVSAEESAGGLVGLVGDGRVLYSAADGQATGKTGIGGLAGTCTDAGQIMASFAGGKVVGTEKAGGLVGEHGYNATTHVRNMYWVKMWYDGRVKGAIHNCASAGDVYGTMHVGGLIGLAVGNDISNCHASGAVSGEASVGGLVGTARALLGFAPMLYHSYCSGNVSGHEQTGGLLGQGDGAAIVNCYWDAEQSGQGGFSSGDAGLESAVLRDPKRFSPRNWDFNLVWKHETNAYPALRDLDSVRALLASCPPAAAETTAADALAIPNAPLSPEEMERVGALGYLIGARPTAARNGVIHHDSARAQQGLNLYSDSSGPFALLIDMDGRLLHRWEIHHQQIWPDNEVTIAGDDWDRLHLYENGDLLVSYGGLAKIDKNSTLLWRYNAQVHHDFEVMPDDRIYVLVNQVDILRRIDRVQPILEDFIVVLDPSGAEMQRVSLIECFENTPEYRHLWDNSHIRRGDVFHANTLRVLNDANAAALPQIRPGHVLTSLREINTIAVIDMERKCVAWACRGPWRAQHDPHLLDNGHLLVFDNYGRPWRSTVYEFTLPQLHEVWRYDGGNEMPLYTETAGKASRLNNGNTLIIESEAGRIIEIDTASGDIVWEFITPNQAHGQPAMVSDLQRLPQGIPCFWKTQ